MSDYNWDNIEWEEKNESPTKKWTEKGQSLKGILIHRERAGPHDSPLHTFQLPNGDIEKYWGNDQLDSALKGLVGKPVFITLEDDQYQYSAGPGKKFSVQVGRVAGSQRDGVDKDAVEVEAVA